MMLNACDVGLEAGHSIGGVTEVVLLADGEWTAQSNHVARIGSAQARGSTATQQAVSERLELQWESELQGLAVLSVVLQKASRGKGAASVTRAIGLKLAQSWRCL